MSSTPGVASYSGMHGVESACYMLSHSRPPISRRRLAGSRTASPRAAVSTHSRGPPYLLAARTLSLTHLLACHTIFPLALFPADSGRAFRALCGVTVGLLGHEQIRFPQVWHFTLRFVLPGVGLATPVDLERRAVAYWTQSLPFGHG